MFYLLIFLNILLIISGQQLSEYAEKPCKFNNDNFVGIYKSNEFNCITLPPNIYPNNITETINGLTKTYFCCPEKRVSDQICDANDYTEVVEHAVGSTIPTEGEIPYIAALFKQKITREGDDPYPIVLFCGSSIISEWYLLTGAHCFMDTDELNYFVTFGKYSIDDLKDEDRIKIKDILLHNDYHSIKKLNDIALIKPEKKIIFYEFIVSPICLHSSKMNNGIFDNEIIKISGWGKWNPNLDESSLILRKVELGYVNQTYCEFRHLNAIIESQFCAFDSDLYADQYNRSDACQGDSGGPARILFNQRSVLVGVVSYGVGCASTVPGIYTRVLSFIDWIETIVWLS